MTEYLVTEWIEEHGSRDHSYIEIPSGLTAEEVEQHVKDWHWQQVKQRFDWQKVDISSKASGDINNDLPF